MLDADELYALVQPRSAGTEPRKLVLTFEKEAAARGLPGLVTAARGRQQRGCIIPRCRGLRRNGLRRRQGKLLAFDDRKRIHDFFDCPEYWHVSHRTVEGKIRSSRSSGRGIPCLPSRAPIPTGSREMLDGEEAVKSVGDATGAADRAPAPEIDERRAVDDAAAPARPPPRRGANLNH